ncbi:MAG: hypothetical protein H7Z12_18590 [Rhodospirillaceae bacterium]|nr:hypothetical protein [Rhodospirillales bacterium]
MQIKTVQTKEGIVFEFIRWSYDAEKKRSKFTSIGRMRATWNGAPEPVLAKMTEEEREEYRQFMKAKVEAERLHTLRKSPEKAVEILTACEAYFRLPKEEKSEEQAIAVCSAMESLCVVLQEVGYQIDACGRAVAALDGKA